MSNLTEVIFFSLIGGVLSLIGGLLLLSKKQVAKALATYATPFAAGALLAAAFVDLLPEAMHDSSADTVLRFTLIGILGFFILEKFLHWFHHHHDHGKDHKDPTIPLIVIGDTLHNFIDGIAIAAGFLIDSSTGIVVTLAVAAHEIPQEIGDFGLLIKKGMSRRAVLLVNIVSALATTLAAIIFYQLGQSVDIDLGIVFGLVAGFFIYIAVSDIIPSIHQNEAKSLAGPQTLLLIVGVVLVGSITSVLHEYIDQGHDHEDVLHAQNENHEHEGDDHHTENEEATDNSLHREDNLEDIHEDEH